MPLAAEGLTATPAGRVTSVFWGWVSATAPSLGLSRPWLGSWSSKSRPLLVSAAFALGPERIFGEKGTASQPDQLMGLPALSRIGTTSETKTPGFDLESALIVSS